MKEALEDLERLGGVTGQAKCFADLPAPLLHGNGPLGATEQAAPAQCNAFRRKARSFCLASVITSLVTRIVPRASGRRPLPFEAALGIAPSFNWYLELALNYCALAWLFLSLAEDWFHNATTHIGRAKSHVVDIPPYDLGHATLLQAKVWRIQSRPEEAVSEASRVLELFERLGAVGGVEHCRGLLGRIKESLTKSPKFR